MQRFVGKPFLLCVAGQHSGSLRQDGCQFPDQIICFALAGQMVSFAVCGDVLPNLFRLVIFQHKFAIFADRTTPVPLVVYQKLRYAEQKIRIDNAVAAANGQNIFF